LLSTATTQSASGLRPRLAASAILLAVVVTSEGNGSTFWFEVPVTAGATET
jgi:hypothetical protein